MKKITLFLSITILLSCRKSNISPLCWGKEKEAMYYYDLCKEWGLLLYKNGDNELIVGKLPSEFKNAKYQTGMKVMVNTRKVKFKDEGNTFTNLPCFFVPIPNHTKDVHVLCIRKF